MATLEQAVEILKDHGYSAVISYPLGEIPQYPKTANGVKIESVYIDPDRGLRRSGMLLLASRVNRMTIEEIDSLARTDLRIYHPEYDSSR